jgi:hypothetical protein
MIDEVDAAYEELSYQIMNNFNLSIEEFRGLK